jgi:hypothetical protein
MGQIAMWTMPKRVNNTPKTIFRSWFAKSPRFTDRKAMVRGISQLVNASMIAVRERNVISPDDIFCKAPGSKTLIA